jgi:hypothetical protein
VVGDFLWGAGVIVVGVEAIEAVIQTDAPDLIEGVIEIIITGRFI